MQALIKKSHTKRDLLYFCQNPCNKLFELLPYRFWLYNFNLPFKGRQPCEKSFTYSDCCIYDIPTINAYRYYIPESFFCHINQISCAKLFMVLDESFILISSDCVSFFWLAGQFLFYTIGVFFSRLIGKPLSYPATIAGFLLYKKSRSLFNDLLHIFYLFSNKIKMSQSFLDCRYHPLGRMRSRMF